jgi:hypothetical protein
LRFAIALLTLLIAIAWHLFYLLAVGCWLLAVVLADLLAVALLLLLFTAVGCC